MGIFDFFSKKVNTPTPIPTQLGRKSTMPCVLPTSRLQITESWGYFFNAFDIQ